MRRGEEEGCQGHEGAEITSQGRLHDNKNRDIIIEGDIFGLQRNQALWKCLEIYKDGTS